MKRLTGIPNGSLFLFFPLFPLSPFPPQFRAGVLEIFFFHHASGRNRGCLVVGVVVERRWVSVRQRQNHMPSPQGLLGPNYYYSNPNVLGRRVAHRNNFLGRRVERSLLTATTSTLTQTSKFLGTTCCIPQQMQHYLITTSGSARRKRQQHLSTSHSLALVSSSPPLPCRVASLDCSTLRRRNIANIRSEYTYTQESLRQHPQ